MSKHSVEARHSRLPSGWTVPGQLTASTSGSLVEAGTVNSVLRSTPAARLVWGVGQGQEGTTPNLRQIHRLGDSCRARPCPGAHAMPAVLASAERATPLQGRPSALRNAGRGGGGPSPRDCGGLGPASPRSRAVALTDLDGRLAAQEQLEALGVVRQAAVVQGRAAFRRLLVQVPTGESGEEAGGESRPRQGTETRARARPATSRPRGFPAVPLPGGRGGLGAGP